MKREHSYRSGLPSSNSLNPLQANLTSQFGANYDQKLASLNPVITKQSSDRSKPTYSSKNQRKIRRNQTRLFTSILIKLWAMLCLICLVYQLTSVTSDYLTYSVTTETTVFVPRKVVPPVLTLCFDFVEIRKPELFSTDSPCYQLDLLQKPEIYAECYRELMSLDLKQIMQMTLELTDLTEKIWFRDPINYTDNYVIKNDTSEFDRFRMGHVTEFMKGDAKCFTIDIFANNAKLGTPNFYYRLVINDAKTEGRILTWYYAEGFLNECHKVDIYMHAAYEHPMGYLISPYMANMSKFLNTVVTYQKVQNTLLPPPYPTSCKHYDSVEFETQMHCVEDCLTNYTIHETHGLLPDSTVKLRHDINERKMTNTSNTGIRLMCVEHCPIDCFEQLYFAKLLLNEEKGNRSISLAVNEPEYKIIYTATTSMSAFIIYIAGVFSLWFGFSMYTTANYMAAIISVACRKRLALYVDDKKRTG